MLLWRRYTTKEASRFRNKVAKIILAETNVETFNTLGYSLGYLTYRLCNLIQTYVVNLF